VTVIDEVRPMCYKSKAHAAVQMTTSQMRMNR
jgi:hypothetical protein